MASVRLFIRHIAVGHIANQPGSLSGMLLKLQTVSDNTFNNFGSFSAIEIGISFPKVVQPRVDLTHCLAKKVAMASVTSTEPFVFTQPWQRSILALDRDYALRPRAAQRSD